MRIVIQGDPIAKARARHTVRNKCVITYDPQSDIKQAVRREIGRQVNDALNSEEKNVSLEASILTQSNSYSVAMWFYISPNASDSEALKNAKLWGLIDASCKPDYDNLEKFYLDCANGVIWLDDRMIVDAKAYKRYGLPARVEIEVMAKKKMKLHPKVEGVLKVFGPDELRQFLSDVRLLANFDPNVVDKIDDYADPEYKSEWLTAVAGFLIDFAAKHSEQIKKCRKFDGLHDDLVKLNECKAALQ